MDYKQAGVNIDEGNRAVELIKPLVKTTHTKNVVSNIGSFAAGFNFPKDDYEDPILVSCTDGVGTKLRIAIECGIFNTVGIDLVAMCVNDLICMGAKPLFFLDYIASHEIIPEQMQDIIAGMAEGCRQSDCALIGGEMAEMNDMYQKNDFDLAGFCVGVVDRKAVIKGDQIKPNDNVYALAASGVHSNGFSLVRKVLTPAVCKSNGIDSISLLTPTKIYVKDVLQLIKTHKITGIANITGGGLAENIARIIPPNVNVHIDKQKIRVLEIFKQIQNIGDISDSEMYKVFNMGVGMVIITPANLVTNEQLYKIGTIKSGAQEVLIE
ncbi:phosphoribosylformylglycinamidine cyclo-ligase [Candidatus Marinamargulisbacteria bacterium SCGC AG-414-C22]|nr:phosphoribosylformylglycinamidine cyclo-ligase [Candidatus Marinamargulisbacteria bacterium SCGC AG-414-C22]